MAFIPLYDGNPLLYVRRPWCAWGLIAINIGIFFFFQHGNFETADRASVADFGLIPALLNHYVERPADFARIPDWLTLFTYAFLHGDFWHLAGNMIFLWVFADNIEDSLGHFKFLIFYALCSLAGGYAYVLSDPHSYAPVIGASGAIAGIVAAYFMLYPYAKVWILVFGRIPLRLNALLVLGFWILFQVYALVSIGTGGENEVAWWTHIGGLLAGSVLVVFLRRRGVHLFARPPTPLSTPPMPPAPSMQRPYLQDSATASPAPAAETPPPAYPQEGPPSVDGPWGRR